MKWLDRLRINRAATRYADKLPAYLVANWGRGSHYTAGQIRSAADKLKLNLRFIALGYAAFLPPEDYEPLVAELPVPMSYTAARAAFLRASPHRGAWETEDGEFRSLGGVTAGVGSQIEAAPGD